MDPSNRVLETFRDGEAQVWAGTTIGEPKGVEPAIPFSEGNTTMTIRVYSPEAGIPVLFKLEVWDNTSISVETIANTTVANEWETLSFDFSNEVEGTAPIDFANPYNKPVVFFNYGTPGSEAGEMTFLWDDIEFVDASFIDDNKYQVLNVYPNPVNEVLNIKNANDLSVVRIYSITGKLMVETTEVTSSIDVSSYPAGMYTISATDGNDNNYNAKFVVK